MQKILLNFITSLHHLKLYFIFEDLVFHEMNWCRWEKDIVILFAKYWTANYYVHNLEWLL